MRVHNRASGTARRMVSWPRTVTLCLLVGCFAAFLPVASANADTAPVLVTFDSQAAANAGTNAPVLAGAQDVGAGVVSVDANRADAVEIARLPGVVAVEPDVAYAAADTPLPSTPDDPCLAGPSSCGGLNAGYLDQIGVRQLWAKTHGPTVTLAVLDTGVDRTYPDIAPKLVGPELDMTAKHDGPGDHGTSVASLAVGAVNNGLASAGVGWDVRLLSVKVLDASGQGRLSEVASGVVAATDNGASVLNLSLSGPYTRALESAIDYAVSKGVVVVAAAGNQGSDNPADGGYPARYPGVVAVGAVDSSDAVASFSNFGSWVDVYAPGVELPAPQLGGHMRAFSGTSAASPVTAGVAALLKAGTPSLSSDDMTALLHDTGVRLGAAQHDGKRLDAAAAAAAPGLFPAAINSPLGTLDDVTRVPGGLRVRGWAIDPGGIGSIPVHTYIDGIGVSVVDSSVVRDDLAAVLPTFGSGHGYDAIGATVPGLHNVCTYGINQGAGVNGLLACRQVEVSSRAFGMLDAAVRTGNALVITGWAIDPDRATATGVNVTLDGIAFVVTAKVPRPDVALAFPDYGASHGFVTTLPGVAPGPHTVCIDALNAATQRTPLGCRTV